MSDLFKWEDGGGLKHHCPICQTPLSHDKCRTQCLGIHVEWCGRYHTLFRKNWSSRCSACKTTDEQHEKRHREIAELVDKINKFRAEEDKAATEPTTPRTPLTARALNTVDGTAYDSVPRTTKKERKRLKKVAKALGRDKVVTSADILSVANTIHPEGEDENDENGTKGTEWTEDEAIRLNLKYNNQIHNTKTARHTFIKKDTITDPEELKAEVARLLEVFAMDTKATGIEGKLVAELAVAIQNDLIHYYDELRTTEKLRNAFWRWANVRAYRELGENGKDWDDHKPIKERGESIEELTEKPGVADKNAAVDSDEEKKSERSGSVGSSIGAASASTVLTAPSVEPSSTMKPKLETLSNVVPPKSKKSLGDPGWTQVGKKVLKSPAVGKLKMVKNGGLHHLAQSPRGSFGCAASANTCFTMLSAEEVPADKLKPKKLELVIAPRSTGEPLDDPGWKQVGTKVLGTPVKRSKPSPKMPEGIVPRETEELDETVEAIDSGQSLDDDSGWTQVGTKAVKSPAVGTAKMVKDGGLRRSTQSR